MPETHSRVVKGKRFIWFTDRLWELARNLPVKQVGIETLPEFDQDCWFGETKPPTCRQVARPVQRINID